MKKSFLVITLLIVTISIVFVGGVFSLKLYLKFVQKPSDIAIKNYGNIDADPVKVFNPEIQRINNQLEKDLAVIPKSLKSELENSRLYLMLTSKNDAPGEYPAQQSFVFENEKFTSAQSATNDVRDFYYNFSQNSEKGVFVKVLDDSKSIHTFEKDTLTKSPFPSIESSLNVDTSSIVRKQNPSISNQGDVLFSGLENLETVSIAEANEWSIFQLVEGRAVFIVHGYMPKWLNNDEFVFLKNDGLYVLDLLSKKEKLLLETNSEVLVRNNNRLDVSTDGTLISWISPNNLSIYVLEKIGDTFKLKTTFKENGFWAVFSPNSKYLAVQVISMDARGSEDKPGAKIMFYDIEISKKVKNFEINLDAFDQLGMFMTEWVKK